MIAEQTRAIGEREEKRLGRIIRRREENIRALPRRSVGCLVFIVLLSGLVYLANPSDLVNRWGALILLGFLVLLCTAIGLSSLFEERRSIDKLQETICLGTVTELTVAADRCFVVRDDDHEMKYYFFDVGEETFVVCDLDLLSKDFPNSEFVIFRIFGHDDAVVDEWVKTHGQRLKPVKSVTLDEILDFEEYEHLSRLPFSFNTLLNGTRSG
jgi:hypothetical protein